MAGFSGPSRLSHVEINVSDYARSIRFYDAILFPLGWMRLLCTVDCAAYADGFSKLVLSPTAEKHRAAGFHRQRTGLNHLAFSVGEKGEVDHFYHHVMVTLGIASLYQKGPAGDDEYYSVLFEDPDRMKLEVVWAPRYCEPDAWPNTIPSDFDPYA